MRTQGVHYVPERRSYRCKSPAYRYQCHLEFLTRKLICIVVDVYLCLLFRLRILADPTSFEEPLLDTTITVILDEQGNLIQVTQLGVETSGHGDTLTKCIAAAKIRRSFLAKNRLYDP